MVRTLTLAAALSATVALPVLAETYDNPDPMWWAAFLDALDGTTPDLEAEARQDPRYQRADEFTRAEVLKTILAEEEEARQQIDPATTVVTLPMRARLGDYDAAAGGFPVDTFRSGAYVTSVSASSWSSQTQPTSGSIRRNWTTPKLCALGSAWTILLPALR